jgi:hypothetical protein
MKKPIKVCECCGARLIEYSHKLNKGMIDSLKKLSEQPNTTANISKIGLTHNQIANFQKLKYWSLVEKGTTSGVWSLSLCGKHFLWNGMEVPERVITFRDKVVGRSDKNISLPVVNDRKYMRKEDYLSEGSIHNKNKGEH